MTIKRWAFHSLLLLGLGGLWELLAGGIFPAFAPLNRALVGHPLGILSELSLLADPSFWPHVGTTLLETVLGLGWALGTAWALALWFATRPGAESLLGPWLNALNALPKLALAPFLVTWVGIGLGSKVWISTSMAFFPLFHATLGGVKALDRDLLAAHRVMGVSGLNLVRVVIGPATLRWTLAALRASTGLALMGAIIGEFIGAIRGLGYLLVGAQGFLATDRALALLVLIGLLGLALDALAHGGERLLPGLELPRFRGQFKTY